MRHPTLMSASWSLIILGGGTAWALENPAPLRTSVSSMGDVEFPPDLLHDPVNDIEALVAPLPPARRIHTHVYRNGKVTSRVEVVEGALPQAVQGGAPGEKLIYSNTGGQRILRFSVPNRRYADDLQTDAVSDCPMSRYLVRVNGGVQNGTGEFSCKVSLFTACPSIAGGGVLIPGTDATFAGLIDDHTQYHDLVVDVSANPISLDTAFWVRAECSTGNSGWVGGTYAELGFTEHRFLHPATGCSSFLGPSFTAGFYVQIFALDDPLAPCLTQYSAYSTSPPVDSLESNLTNQRIFEDFQTALAPTGDSCRLTAYEVAGRGKSGPYTMMTDLRTSMTAAAVPGTDMLIQGIGDERFDLARRRIDPGLNIILPPESWFLSWQVDKSATSLALAKGTLIGFTNSHHYLPCPPPCPVPVVGEGIFYLRVFCAEEEATGACCVMPTGGGEAFCLDHVRAVDCQDGRWAKNGLCADNPFDTPCGTAACCTSAEVCLDLFEEECQAVGGFWNAPTRCAEADDNCGLVSCMGATGECDRSHDSPGCRKPACCNLVCAAHPECCTQSWRIECLRVAADLSECVQPPQGDVCASTLFSPQVGAGWVAASSELFVNNTQATGSETYCCSDSAEAAVSRLYFRFDATDTSTRISTCGTEVGDAADSLIQVYRVGDPTTELTACDSLTPIACNDDRWGCGDGTMSDLCVTGLTPGETYYFTLASKSAADRGIYHLSLESPCSAEQLAGPCTEGLPLWDAPASGTVVDARQPFDPEAPDEPFGVMAVTVQAPPHAEDAACWTLCDTLGNPQGNDVLTVEDHGNGSLTLNLAHPLTPGAETKIAYNNSGGCASAAGSFSYLPGDVNGHNGAIASEDGALFGLWCLSDPPGLGLERCDIDRTGIITAADYIRLIDLFNGAGPFDAWNGRTVSTAPCE